MNKARNRFRFFDAINKIGGDANFNGGTVTFDPDSVTNFTGRVNQGRTRYYTEPSQITLNTAQTHYYLESGAHVFDTVDGSPFILSLPIELEQGVGIEIVGNATVLYVGSGTLFDQTLTGQTILTLTSMLLLGDASNPAAGRTLFNLEGNGAARPVLLFNFVQPLLWTSLGTLTGFDTIVLSNFSIRFCLAGLTIDDSVNLVSGGPMNLQDSVAPMTFLTFTGTTSPSIQFAQINFIPNFATEYCLDIQNTLTPNVSVGSSVFDSVNIADKSLKLFYKPGSLDEASIYVKSLGVKNVLDSHVEGELLGNGGTTTTTINTANAWYTLRLPPTPSVENENRIVGNTTNAQQTYTGLERTEFVAYSQVSLDVSSGTHIIETEYFLLTDTVATTVDAVADTFTSVGHGFTGGEHIIFDATVFPTGLTQHGFYYVIFVDVDTFQVEDVVGGGAINMTTTGTAVTWREAIEEGFPSAKEIQVNKPQVVVNSSLVVDVLTGNSVVLAVRNTLATADVLCDRYQSRIRD